MSADIPSDLMTPQYVISDLTSTSQQVTIEDLYMRKFDRLIIDNSLGATPAFVIYSKSSATAVYPTSASAALLGKVIAAGSVQTFSFNPDAKYIAAIRESGTADLCISLTTGE